MQWSPLYDGACLRLVQLKNESHRQQDEQKSRALFKQRGKE
jgi:hypothetical protein